MCVYVYTYIYNEDFEMHTDNPLYDYLINKKNMQYGEPYHINYLKPS